ncbi:hypothetical protein AAE121_005330, partial [Salmonella enterica]
MPVIGFLIDALFGLFVRLGAWGLRYIVPEVISILLYRSTSSYAIIGVSVFFYISTFLAVMTFINNQVSSLISSLVLPDDYWVIGLSMLPSNILSC